MYKKLIMPIFLILICGCASTKNYEMKLDSWLGHSANELVSSWGYPQSSLVAPNGNTVYIYGNSGSYGMPSQTNSTYNVVGNTIYGNSYTTGGQTINFWCRTFFEVNESKKIISWKWEGNNCISE